MCHCLFFLLLRCAVCEFPVLETDTKFCGLFCRVVQTIGLPCSQCSYQAQDEGFQFFIVTDHDPAFVAEYGPPATDTPTVKAVLWFTAHQCHLLAKFGDVLFVDATNGTNNMDWPITSPVLVTNEVVYVGGGPVQAQAMK